MLGLPSTYNQMIPAMLPLEGERVRRRARHARSRYCAWASLLHSRTHGTHGSTALTTPRHPRHSRTPGTHGSTAFTDPRHSCSMRGLAARRWRVTTAAAAAAAATRRRYVASPQHTGTFNPPSLLTRPYCSRISLQKRSHCRQSPSACSAILSLNVYTNVCLARHQAAAAAAGAQKPACHKAQTRPSAQRGGMSARDRSGWLRHISS